MSLADTHTQWMMIYAKENKMFLPVRGVKMSSEEPIRIDEMGIEVCIVCDCAIEYNKCLCDMRGW